MVEKFLCYKAGILNGVATFENKQILFQERSYYSDMLAEPQAVLDNVLFHPALFDLWEKAAPYRWVEEAVQLGAYEYEHFMRIEDPVRGEGHIYAQMRSDSPIDIVVCDGQLAGFLIPHRNESITIVKEGYEGFTNQRLWNDPLISPDQYVVDELGICSVPMRDGVNLSTLVVLPMSKGSEQWPTILIRTCYNKYENKMLWIKYAKRGYAVVIQDVRGREASEGDWIPFANEMGDGDDTLDWIADQPWSNGRVGMLGGSYLGFVQWAAAASGNKHLKAIVSQVTAGSPFIDLPRRGGTFGSGILAWSFMVAKRATDTKACVRDDWEKLLAHRPIREIPELALGEGIPFYDLWMAHSDNDDFWKQSDWSLHDQQIDVPALCVSGWFDDDGPGTTQAWAMNSKNQRKNQRLLIGPWLHKANGSRKIHHYELAKNALRYDLDCLYLRWFDRFLKGIENGVETEQQVEYYMLGDNTWRSCCQWPPENVKLQRLFLDCQGDARSAGGDGILVQEQPVQASSSEYACDPYNPFPYLIDVSENECAVPEDYSDAENRMDVLVYTGPVCDHAIAIAGDVRVTFYAESSCFDTDWVVRLTDVGPDGSSIKLADGVLRGRYRHSFEQAELLTPGKIEVYEIQMTRIAHTFKQGHRIRLQITSGADNLCFANSNTGGNESLVTSMIKAINKVHHGGITPSFITLPVIE